MPGGPEYPVLGGVEYKHPLLPPTSGGVAATPSVAAPFIGSVTAVHDANLSPAQFAAPFISSVTSVHAPAVGFTGVVTVSIAGTYTWVCPPGVTAIEVQAYGGGGPGDSDPSNLHGFGGGGGGAFAARTAVPVTPGTAYTFVVGAPGAIHSAGGDSSFTGDSGVQVLAKGGGAGALTVAGAGGAAGSSIGDGGLVFSGGAGGAGTTLTENGGGGGASGNILATGNAGQNSNHGGSPPQSGGAGANGGGSGGVGAVTTPGSNASAGTSPGGGGGGGCFNVLGSIGTAGRIAITEVQISMTFIPSVTQVFTAQTNPRQVVSPFIASVTSVHTPIIATSDSTVFTVAGTYNWLCPAGITSVEVFCYGGGGGSNTNTGNGGHAGGGGGAFAGRVAVPVTPGNLYTVVVGAGGVAGSNGTDSTFTGDSGVQVIAKAGHAPPDADITSGPGGTASGSTGDTGLKFSGGAGGTGLASPGVDGAGGGASGNRLATGNAGSSSPTRTGGAGANGGGSGGLGGQYNTGNPAPGGAPGGGAGGGGGFDTGTHGADGEVDITVTKIFMGFIASTTQVFQALTNPRQAVAPFIPSVTVVYAATLTSDEVFVPFLASNTRVYTPNLRVAFTGGGVSQVTLEVTTTDTTGDAYVTQVTLELLVPFYKGLHVWERT